MVRRVYYLNRKIRSASLPSHDEFLDEDEELQVHVKLVEERDASLTGGMNSTHEDVSSKPQRKLLLAGFIPACLARAPIRYNSTCLPLQSHTLVQAKHQRRTGGLGPWSVGEKTRTGIMLVGSRQQLSRRRFSQLRLVVAWNDASLPRTAVAVAGARGGLIWAGGGRWVVRPMYVLLVSTPGSLAG